MFVWLFLGAFLTCLTCVCTFICVHARINRKEKYRKMCNRAVEKLPDCENKYLRSRLANALACAEAGKTPTDASLGYVRKLLKELTEKQLSGADVLVARKLQKQIGEYAEKSKVSAYEKERLPHVLTSLLTLCAKYEI